MKISFMTFACPDWPFERVVAAAVEHGYHGVEFRCDVGHAHGVEVTASPDRRQQIKNAMADADLEVCCLATSLSFVRDEAVTDAPARIQLAADLDCPRVRVFCGGLPEHVDMEAAVEKVGDQLREVADLASQSQVELLLETHDSMSRGVDCAAAVRRANHRAVAVNYDNMHPYRLGESLTQTVSALSGLVRHTHLHDAMNSVDKVVVTPLGEGQMPMDEMFAALVGMGFDGYLSGEWFNDQYGSEPDEALARYHRDMTALAQRHGVRLGG